MPDVRPHGPTRRRVGAFDNVTVSPYPRSVWADRFDPPTQDTRHDPHDARDATRVVVDRVVDRGYHEVAEFV
jgi:hypothetical protein